ncbi:hypothetical protein [Flavobacterium psychrotrophum]|uniref:hypothetical protein n=1 Tax=Flavobacterium psychrotrophum TaxID=2294119 RepID=UPI0013C47361|nr:hypothetical protein [Flavobacterium psychrotrophum]
MMKTLSFIGGAILIFLLFAFGIPVVTYEGAPIFFSILGALVCSILLAIAVGKIVPKPNNSEYKEQAQQDPTGCWMAVAGVVFFIGFCWYFIANGNSRREDELKQFGTYTVATISDGSSGGSGSILTLKFLNKKDEKCTVNFDISGRDFGKFYKDQQLPIIYSEKNPSIIQPLFDDKDYAKYTGTKVRDIAIKDLQHLYTLKTQKEITAYLNSVNHEWKYDYLQQDSSDLYLNEFKAIGIKIKGERISYILDEANVNVFDSQLKDAGFEELETGEKLSPKEQLIMQTMRREHIFITHNYMAVIRNEQMEPMERKNSDDITFKVPRQVTVITLLKK